MRKLLIILLVINAMALAIGFFMMLANSILYSIIFLAIGMLELIPIIAIISCLDDIEDLQYENNYLRTKIKKIEDSINGDVKEEEITVAHNPTAAKAAWECIKCGTVNKVETAECSNCNAPYSPFLNPTDDPKRKKKISRFVKFK